MAKYVTKQRKILQDYFSQRIDQELSAKQVAEELSSQGISLSAVYRNLADMEKEKIVVQTRKEGSREFFFRYIDAESCQECFHLSCRSCGKIMHLPLEDSMKISEAFSTNYSFSLDFPTTVFYGTCGSCLTVLREQV